MATLYFVTFWTFWIFAENGSETGTLFTFICVACLVCVGGFDQQLNPKGVWNMMNIFHHVALFFLFQEPELWGNLHSWQSERFCVFISTSHLCSSIPSLWCKDKLTPVWAWSVNDVDLWNWPGLFTVARILWKASGGVRENSSFSFAVFYFLCKKSVNIDIKNNWF